MFSGIDKNFTRTSANEGNVSCPKCRVGEKPTKLVEQRNKPDKNGNDQTHNRYILA